MKKEIKEETFLTQSSCWPLLFISTFTWFIHNAKFWQALKKYKNDLFEQYLLCLSWAHLFFFLTIIFLIFLIQMGNCEADTKIMKKKFFICFEFYTFFFFFHFFFFIMREIYEFFFHSVGEWSRFWFLKETELFKDFFSIELPLCTYPHLCEIVCFIHSIY